MEPEALRGAWEATQALLRVRALSAGHDISDGGAAVALLEMAFAGNAGIEVCPAWHHALCAFLSMHSILLLSHVEDILHAGAGCAQRMLPMHAHDSRRRGRHLRMHVKAFAIFR